MHGSGGGQRFFEIHVNSRRPVIAFRSFRKLKGTDIVALHTASECHPLAFRKLSHGVHALNMVGV